MHLFLTAERETSAIFLQDQNMNTCYLQTKHCSELVWHLPLSETATVALVLAPIPSRSNNWGLFSFGLAAWNHSFGQSIMPVSKMPAKHCSREAKSPFTCTKKKHLHSGEVQLFIYIAIMHPALDTFKVVAELSDLSDGNNCLLTLNLYSSRALHQAGTLPASIPRNQPVPIYCIIFMHYTKEG